MQGLLAETYLRGDGALLGLLILVALMAIVYVFGWLKRLRRSTELSDEEIVTMIRYNPVNDQGLDLEDPDTFNLFPPIGELEDEWEDLGPVDDDPAFFDAGSDSQTLRVLNQSGECVGMLCVPEGMPDEIVMDSVQGEEDDPSSDPDEEND